MAELLIIADDITGAVEAGVKLSKQNIATEIVVDWKMSVESVFSDISFTTVVVNTESRHVLPKEASKRVKFIVKQGVGCGIKYFYKKTDSTLRGNIGVELQALLSETKQGILPYIPAHPRLKRFTKNGYQYIDDVLLHKTSFANDPLEPVRDSFIPSVLKRNTDLEIVISTPYGSQETENVAADSKRIEVFDCQSVDDLYRIGACLKQKKLHIALAGTAAMVEVLPSVLSLSVTKLETITPKSPVLIVNGSLNEVSLQQIEYAKKEHVTIFKIPDMLFFDEGKRRLFELKIFLNKIKSALANGENVVITTTEINNITQPDMKKIHLVPKQVGKIVVEIIQDIPEFTLGVFGGDTLNGILNELNVNIIKPNGELMNGIAWSSVECFDREIPLITKPGGYGEKDEIMKIFNQIKKLEE